MKSQGSIGEGASSPTVAFSDVPLVTSVSSASLLQETQGSFCSSLREIIKKVLWGSSIPYALFITAIYAMFAVKRANNDPLDIALFASASVLFNVFGALLFPKRTAGLVADFSHRYDDPFYWANFGFSVILAGMTVLASIEISESSVKDWPGGAMYPAVFAFGLNTATTRLVGGVDVFDRVRRAIEFRTVFQFLREFELKKDLLETKNQNWVSLAEGFEPVQWIADEMRAVPLPLYRSALDWGQWFLRSALSASSLVLIPMWISMTQSGLGKLHDGWGDQTALVTIAAMSNALFYGVSIYDVIPAMLELHQKLSEKLAKKLEGCVTNPVAEALIRHSIVLAALGAFSTIAYYSGGGFGATVSGMEKNGFGTVAAHMTPDLFFSLTQGNYSYIAQAMAGLVNLNSTARFILAIMNKQKELSDQNIMFVMLNFMELYKKTRPAMTPLDSGDTLDAGLNNRSMTLGEPVTILETPFELVAKMVTEIGVAVRSNKFVKKENGKNRRRSCRDLLALPGAAVSVGSIEAAYRNRVFQPVAAAATETSKLLASGSLARR